MGVSIREWGRGQEWWRVVFVEDELAYKGGVNVVD
jgi:hypothetical protein